MKHRLAAIVAGTTLHLFAIAGGAVLVLSLAACSHQPPIQHGAPVIVASEPSR